MLRIEKLTRRFDDVLAVDTVSLAVDPGEFVTLLGPSGCGKTTTLRMIAGFETPTAGRIFLDGRDVTKLPPQQRGVGMVFQNYALFPHLDVFENVAFGLKARRLGRKEVTARVEQALERVDLAGYGSRRVQELSGGQQQRVALARALAPEPPVLLLDEPLSNLDAALRQRTRTELRELLKRLGITAVFVTHDQEEAFGLSDRIALLENGRLQQVDTPEMLYNEPVNPFVASFLGRANFLAARIVEEAGPAVLCELQAGARWHARIPAANGGADGTGGVHTPDAAPDAPSAPGPPAAAGAGGAPGTTAPGGLATRPTGASVAVDHPVQVMIRPEALRILPSNAGARRATDLEGTVLERRFAGAVTHYRIRAGELELLAHGTPADARPGETVVVRPLEGPFPLAFPAPDQLSERVPA